LLWTSAILLLRYLVFFNFCDRVLFSSEFCVRPLMGPSDISHSKLIWLLCPSPEKSKHFILLSMFMLTVETLLRSPIHIVLVSKPRLFRSEIYFACSEKTAKDLNDFRYTRLCNSCTLTDKGIDIDFI
jgi:hypothetical protein